ncbi:MAG: fimbria major subunit [Prevotella sp.]|nr:fimbria major subunit [Prevotella sp.]
MKKLSILALAAVGLLFGACSSSDVTDESNTDPFKGREGGFIKVGINLPVQPVVSTRAWQESATGTLDDGLTTEYAVNNCILLLFEGADEASATLKQVENVTEGFTNLGDNPNQVTTYTTKTVQLLNAPTSNLYALAVVNGTGYIEMASNSTVKINGGAAKGGIKLADLTGVGAIVNASSKNFHESGFFMANAVLSESQGGTVAPTGTKTHVLAPVDATRIYETEAEATAATSPSADIYLERAVAKVTIDGTATDYLAVTALKNADASAVTAASLTGWAIDNYNATSYLVRNTSGFTTWDLISQGASASVDKYRFVGANPVDGGHSTKVAKTGYRTYWAIDPNYSAAWASGNFITAPDGNYQTAIGDENPQYCFENTFDVAHMAHNQTTRVVFKVQLNGGTDFYTLGADKKTIYKLDDVKKTYATALMGNSTFKTWFTSYGAGTLSYDKLTLTLGASTYGVVTLTDILIDGTAHSGGTPVTVNASAINIDGQDLSNVVSEVNAVVGKITKYTGGMAYYQIRVKHFGDDLTPWNTDEYMTGYAPAESSIAAIYPDATDSRQTPNYLGRYGMVRNNWYVLQIGAISKIGSATVPDINRDKPTTPDPNDPEDPEHPDDELEDAYIKARINILSWAKRVQSWNLK